MALVIGALLVAVLLGVAVYPATDLYLRAMGW